jgi:hypothetical protein
MPYRPDSQEAIQEARRLRDEDVQRQVEGREQQLAEAAAGPEDRTENVLVAKTSARAAAPGAGAHRHRQAQQQRPTARASPSSSSRGRRAPAEYKFTPAHPPVPGPTGSAPHSEGMPAGPQGEDVRYETDDILEDGTPLIQGQPAAFVEQQPHIDGESDREYPADGRRWQHGPAEFAEPQEPLVNQHSPEGAQLDSIKRGGQPVEYVPNAATLDPVSGRGQVTRNGSGIPPRARRSRRTGTWLRTLASAPVQAGKSGPDGRHLARAHGHRRAGRFGSSAERNATGRHSRARHRWLSAGIASSRSSWMNARRTTRALRGSMRCLSAFCGSKRHS